MTSFQAILLGLIQGLTEFLPVSSSGHLVIAQTLMGFQTPPVLFDTVIHTGTLLAVVIYFRSRLSNLSKEMIRFALIGTLPAAFVGLYLDSYVETIFSSLTFVAIGLLITTFFLLGTHLIKPPKSTNINSKSAFITGLFQALAIWPGISRSGSTVAAGLFQGQNKQNAFFFSFLLAIPAILGALALQVIDLPPDQAILSFPNIFGFFTAVVSGLFAIRLLELTIKHFKLHYFALYTFPLALLSLLLS